MPAVPVDIIIRCRWIVPMSSPGELLERHALVIRDGRIVDLLPCEQASVRYAANSIVERNEHVLLPGLVNAYARITPPPGCVPPHAGMQDGALLCIAEMLKGGTTCFAALGFYPDESARVAAEQGMRVLIGIPIAETASRWADSPRDYLTRALNFRDEYRGHPTIATAFAPQGACAMSDDTFARIATLAAELDASIVMALHESTAEVSQCVQRHKMRPIERMNVLGLLTPALTAAHMVHVEAADIEAAARCGIGVAVCPEASLRSGEGMPPVSVFAGKGMRLGLGSGVDSVGTLDLWGAMRLLALHSPDPYAALAAATQGGAAALGLDGCTGTLQVGKWADICCVDLRGPAMRRAAWCSGEDPVAQIVFHAGRDTVSDVWVGGRHLLDNGAPTRRAVAATDAANYAAIKGR